MSLNIKPFEGPRPVEEMDLSSELLEKNSSIRKAELKGEMDSQRQKGKLRKKDSKKSLLKRLDIL